MNRLCVAGIALLWLNACGSEEKKADPEAAVAFLHESSVLGEVDVLLDGEVELSLEPGDLSDLTSVSLGEHDVSVRNAGAEATIVDAQIDFVAAPYLVVLSGSGAADPASLWHVGLEPAAALADDEGAVGALNLDPNGFEYDVWLGDTRVASGLANDRKASPSRTVPAGDQNLRVFNAGDDPMTARPVLSRTISVEDQATLLLVLRVVDDVLDVLQISQG